MKNKGHKKTFHFLLNDGCMRVDLSLTSSWTKRKWQMSGFFVQKAYLYIWFSAYLPPVLDCQHCISVSIPSLTANTASVLRTLHCQNWPQYFLLQEYIIRGNEIWAVVCMWQQHSKPRMLQCCHIHTQKVGLIELLAIRILREQCPENMPGKVEHSTQTPIAAVMSSKRREVLYHSGTQYQSCLLKQGTFCDCCLQNIELWTVLLTIYCLDVQ